MLQRPDSEHVEGFEGINKVVAFIVGNGGYASARAVSNRFVVFLVDWSYSPVYCCPSLVLHRQEPLGVKLVRYRCATLITSTISTV